MEPTTTTILLADHDASATLEAAFALVDSCSSATSSASISSQGCDAGSSGNEAITTRHNQPTGRRVRKLNTAVITDLREEVAQLSSRLRELQEHRAVAPLSDSSHVLGQLSAEWRRQRFAAKGSAPELDAAMRELGRLQRARKLNATLRATWKVQATLASELRAIMTKQRALTVRDRQTGDWRLTLFGWLSRETDGGEACALCGWLCSRAQTLWWVSGRRSSRCYGAITTARS